MESIVLFQAYFLTNPIHFEHLFFSLIGNHLYCFVQLFVRSKFWDLTFEHRTQNIYRLFFLPFHSEHPELTVWNLGFTWRVLLTHFTQHRVYIIVDLGKLFIPVLRPEGVVNNVHGENRKLFVSYLHQTVC